MNYTARAHTQPCVQALLRWARRISRINYEPATIIDRDPARSRYRGHVPTYSDNILGELANRTAMGISESGADRWVSNPMQRG